MRQGYRWAALVLVLVLPVGAQDKGKGKGKGGKKGANEASEADYKALGQLGKAVGKLLSTEGKGESISFEYQSEIATPKKGAAGNLNKQQAQWLKRQQQIMLIRNPYQRQLAMQKLIAQIQAQQAKGGANLFQVKVQKTNFDLPTVEEVKVRFIKPPIKYDDKGNIVEYSSKELKEMKGKDKLPGYEGNWESLKPGQVVRIYLRSPKKSPAKKDKTTDKKDEETKDELSFPKPLVRMIVVLSDPETPDDDKGTKGKKKKKN